MRKRGRVFNSDNIYVKNFTPRGKYVNLLIVVYFDKAINALYFNLLKIFIIFTIIQNTENLVLARVLLSQTNDWQSMAYKVKTTVTNLLRSLHDKKSCREFLEQQRWNGIPECPHCGFKSEKHYKLKRSGEFNGLYKCPDCRRTFTVTVGTVFDGSSVPLIDWFYAIHMLISHKKGISSLQLAKDIGVTKKTAWYMLHRIRRNLIDKKITKFGGVVQIDETYVGGKNKGRFKNNRGRSAKQKTPVVGLLTNDRVYTVVVAKTDKRTLHTIVYGLVEAGSTIVTDEWPAYYGLHHDYTHEIVTHGIKLYVNENGFHTNGIEGFWSQLKRGIRGIYHLVSRKYLQDYCDEFSYKYNTRDMTDIERFMSFISTPGKRIKCTDLRYGMS